MPTRAEQAIAALTGSEKIRTALDFIRQDHDARIAEMKELALVQGETGKESLARSPKYLGMLQRDGALDCAIDGIGNAYGYLYGPGGREAPRVLIEAHLDTVFTEDTPLAIRAEGGLIYCPGIGDDAAGLSLILSVLRAIRHAGLVPVRNVMAAGTACEEAQGNFNGMRKLLADHPEIVASVSIDGDGNDRVCRQGVGVKRTEFIFRGPGGHSWMDYGLPACMHAMCRAMNAIAVMELPKAPKTTVNIGVVGGGTSVGAIATEARVHVDMRSLDAGCLKALEERVLAAVHDGVAAENAFRGKTSAVTVEARSYSDIPAAQAPPDGILVRAAIAASGTLRLEPNMAYSASTNANIPMSRGLPALTLGYGGISRDIHSPAESYDPTEAFLAVRKTLLVLFALAGLEGVHDPLV